MEKVSIYDWFERMAKVSRYLTVKNYVALSDVESYNTWIVFKKIDEKVIISILKTAKEQGSHDIEFFLKDPVAGEWIDQVVSFEQLQQEVIEKGRRYIKDIMENNEEKELVVKIKKSFEEILECSLI